MCFRGCGPVGSTDGGTVGGTSRLSTEVFGKTERGRTTVLTPTPFPKEDSEETHSPGCLPKGIHGVDTGERGREDIGYKCLRRFTRWDVPLDGSAPPVSSEVGSSPSLSISGIPSLWIHGGVGPRQEAQGSHTSPPSRGVKGPPTPPRHKIWKPLPYLDGFHIL